MNYAEAREQIKSGDLIALTHIAWSSLYDLEVQAVRFGTQSEYAHVCVAWVFAGRVFVIESVKPVVRIFPLSNLKDHGFYWVPTNVPMINEELEFGMSQVGFGKYSNIQAVMGQLNTLNIGEDDIWQCSEFTIAMRRHSGLDLGSKATPAAVIKKAQECGYPLNFVLTNKTTE